MKTINSFKNAFNGVAFTFVTQSNFRLHILAFVIVIFLGIGLKINLAEWCVLLFSSALVLSAELFNTSFEYLSDFITKEKREEIRKVKDIAAGAVLILSIVALIIGGIIFIPKIFLFLK